MNESKIGIVILNFGCPDDTINLVSSIRQIDRSILIAIVDNFSNIDNLKRLKKFKAKGDNLLFLIENKKNDGYGAGNNLGFSLLFDQFSCDACIAINPDVLLNDDFSLDAVKAENWENEVLFSGIVCQHATELSIHLFNPYLFISKPLKHLGSIGAEPKYISGCFWGLSKAMWHKTGGFSTKYFLYFEELDFIYRYKAEQNFFPKLKVFDSIKVTHLEGGSTGSSPDSSIASSFADYWSSRSRIIFARTHLARYLIFAIGYNLLKASFMLYKLRLGNVKKIIQGTVHGLFQNSK